MSGQVAGGLPGIAASGVTTDSAGHWAVGVAAGSYKVVIGADLAPTPQFTPTSCPGVVIHRRECHVTVVGSGAETINFRDNGGPAFPTVPVFGPGGFGYGFYNPYGGGFSANTYQGGGGAGATIARARKHRVRVGSVLVKRSRADTITHVFVKLNRQGKRLLRRHATLKVTVQLTFKLANRQRIVLSHGYTLKVRRER